MPTTPRTTTTTKRRRGGEEENDAASIYDDDGDSSPPGRPSTPERIMDGMYVCGDDDGPKDDYGWPDDRAGGRRLRC